MKYATLMFGALILIVGVFSDIPIVMWGPFTVMLFIYAAEELQEEETHKKQAAEIMKLGEEIKTLKDTIMVEKQLEEIDVLKNEIRRLKAQQSKKSKS